MSVCCACKRKEIPGSNIMFHVFPRNRTQSDKWCKAVGLVCPPALSTRLCSKHFTEQDYTTSYDGVSKGKILLPTAVPSKNLRSKSGSEGISSTIASKLKELGEILQQNADPQSVDFSHDQDSQIITIRYRANPIPKSADGRQRRVCSRCNAILQLADFDAHAKICVGGKLKPYQCGTCASCYETVKELRNHKCQDPEETDQTERREQLELLTKAITGQEYDSDSDEMDVAEEVLPNKRCPECERFIPVSRMQMHYRKFHRGCKNGPFPCRLCQSQFETCEDLSKHLKSHTAKQLRSMRNRKPDGILYDNNGSAGYECYLCGNVFETVESVRLHQGTHLGDNIRCPICWRNFELKFDYLKHLASHQ